MNSALLILFLYFFKNKIPTVCKPAFVCYNLEGLHAYVHLLRKLSAGVMLFGLR